MPSASATVVLAVEGDGFPGRLPAPPIRPKRYPFPTREARRGGENPDPGRTHFAQKGNERCSSYDVAPLLEIIKKSRGSPALNPDIPVRSVGGMQKTAGVPVLHSVATIFRARDRDFPSPVTTSFPLWREINSHGAWKIRVQTPGCLGNRPRLKFHRLLAGLNPTGACSFASYSD